MVCGGFLSLLQQLGFLFEQEIIVGSAWLVLYDAVMIDDFDVHSDDLYIPS